MRLPGEPGPWRPIKWVKWQRDTRRLVTEGDVELSQVAPNAGALFQALKPFHKSGAKLDLFSPPTFDVSPRVNLVGTLDALATETWGGERGMDPDVAGDVERKVVQIYVGDGGATIEQPGRAVRCSHPKTKWTNFVFVGDGWLLSLTTGTKSWNEDRVDLYLQFENQAWAAVAEEFDLGNAVALRKAAHAKAGNFFR